MKNRGLWILLLVIGVVLGWMMRGRQITEPVEMVQPEEPEVAKEEPLPGWQRIKVVVNWDEENKTLSLETDPHDFAVIGSEDKLEWVLDCPDCRNGTQFRVTQFRALVDLSRLSDTVIEISQLEDDATLEWFQNPSQERIAAGAGTIREALGLYMREGAQQAEGTFDFDKLGPDGWVDVNQPIVGTSAGYPSKFGSELWKFDLEVRVPRVSADESNEEYPYGAKWDPHSFRHGPSY